MKVSMKIVAMFVATLACQSALAAAAPPEGASELQVNRMNKPLSTSIGLASAGPAGLGVGVGYSVLPWAKVVGGYSEQTITTSVSFDSSGNVATGSTKYKSFAVGAQISVPTWNLTPIGGLNVAHYSVKSDDEGATFQGLKEGSGTLLYSTLGGSWQTHSGYMMDAGVNIPLGGKLQSTAFIDVGWAWDIL